MNCSVSVGVAVSAHAAVLLRQQLELAPSDRTHCIFCKREA